MLGHEYMSRRNNYYIVVASELIIVSIQQDGHIMHIPQW